jgi:hypothetical protein
LDESMLTALQRWADDEFRSVNGQIEYLLREALIQHGRMKKQPVQQVVETTESDKPSATE